MNIINHNHPNALDMACRHLQDGKVISFATDTVYGLACDAANHDAVATLFSLKKRDSTKPIAIFVENLDMAKEIFLFDAVSQKLAKNLLPGSITLILQRNPDSSITLSENLNSQNNSLGFRIVDDHFVAQLMAQFSGVLAVTSANLANQAPALSANDVEGYFHDSPLSLIIDGGIKNDPEVSTVIRVIDDKVDILRQGKVTQDSINLMLDSCN